MRYRPADFYAKMDCQTRLGVSAVEIDRVQKQVVLEDGEKLPYDQLLIATGSRPFTPPIKGLSSVRSAYTFMTLEEDVYKRQVMATRPANAPLSVMETSGFL